MAGRAIRATSRIVFFLCGLVSLLTGVPFLLMQGTDLPYQSEWVIFVAALGLVGLFSVTIAVLPRSWIAKVCRKAPDDKQLFRSPFKWLGAFAAISYVVAVGAYLVPQRWNIDSQIMLSLCPLYVVRMTLDPSLMTIFFLLAPMNAAVYGSLGLTLRFSWLAFRRPALS
jgi:hypothetical protein